MLHWKAWRQVLHFLSHIDQYRFARYFAIPVIEKELIDFGVPDGIVTPQVVDNVIKRILTKETHFSFVKDEETGKYRQKRFGPYHNIDSYFVDGFMQLTTHIFLLGV